MLLVLENMTGNGIREILAQNIKTLRAHRQFSQAELAEKADISIPFLSSIECANKWPYPDTLAKIANSLEIEVDKLFLKQDSKKDTVIAKEIIQEIFTQQQKATESILEKFFGS